MDQDRLLHCVSCRSIEQLTTIGVSHVNALRASLMIAQYRDQWYQKRDFRTDRVLQARRVTLLRGSRMQCLFRWCHPSCTIGYAILTITHERCNRYCRCCVCVRANFWAVPRSALIRLWHSQSGNPRYHIYLRNLLLYLLNNYSTPTIPL